MVAQRHVGAWLCRERERRLGQLRQRAHDWQAALLLHPPRPSHRQGGRDRGSVVGGADDVEGAATEGGLDQTAVVQGQAELVGVEVRKAGPEPDVGRGRLLGLQSADGFGRRNGVERRSSQQQLASERGPVEGTSGQAHRSAISGEVAVSGVVVAQEALDLADELVTGGQP